jgi:hypothetical protein
MLVLFPRRQTVGGDRRYFFTENGGYIRTGLSPLPDAQRPAKQ